MVMCTNGNAYSLPTEMPNMIPKQLRYWAKRHKILPIGHLHYYVGRGRFWRIDAAGELQVSCPANDFDRWANSVEYSFEVPKTQSEFDKLVALVEVS